MTMCENSMRSLQGPLANASTKAVLSNALILRIAVAIETVLTDVLGKENKADDERITASHIYRGTVSPPRPELGDFAVPCFPFSKPLKRSPAEAAIDIAHALRDSPLGSFSASGPYLNVRISHEILCEEVLRKAHSGALLSKPLILEPSSVMLEFSQPNTHKELHVGHMRNMCLGDALTRCARYGGIKVVTATFPGDVGTHVAKCLWYLKHRSNEPMPETDRGTWLGKIYAQATSALAEEENTDQASTNQEALTKILQQIKNEEGEFFELWKETREWSIDLLNEAYRWAGITFDRWYWESEVDSESVEYVKALHKAGKIVESKGALGADLSDQGLGFCMLLKSDGNGLYASKDLLLAQRKFEDATIDKSIYLVDLRQTYHFQQVFATLQSIGFEHAQDCFHLPYNYVELPDGAMSSRKGNIVPLKDLIHRMETTVKEKHLNKFVEEWGQEEVDRTSSIVAQGAIKFGMNQVEPGTKIVFDMEKWLRLDGNSGPYLQYTCARINSILRKAEYEEKLSDFDHTLLESATEHHIMVTLSNFNDVVTRVVESLKTNLLCDYLITLARLFNTYYAQEKIFSEKTPDLSNARVALCSATLQVLRTGLSLLGISVPPRM